MTTTINFYEGSYLFDSIKTDLNVSPNVIEHKLAMQYEYRPTEETLWATISQDSKEVSRFQLNYGIGLIEIKSENKVEQTQLFDTIRETAKYLAIASKAYNTTPEELIGAVVVLANMELIK